MGSAKRKPNNDANLISDGFSGMIRLDMDKSRLTTIIDVKVGGIERLMDLWAERFIELPDRSTFYAWVSSASFTGNFVSYLRLCACLDVDPVGLLSDSVFESTSFGDLLLMLAVSSRPDRRSRSDGTGRGIKVNDVLGLFGPLEYWPASKPIQKAFGRDWHRVYFENTGQPKSRYETIAVKADPLPLDWPHIIHFAYKISSATRWRMYGSVEAWGEKNRLIHLYGKNQSSEARNIGELIVETRFGEGSCEFCLASIHDFRIDLMGERAFCDALRFRG